MSADYSEYQNGAPLPSSEVVISRVRFEELRRLASIIEDSNDVIISKTIEGTINGWNGGAERIFGYTSREIVGEPISRLTIAGCEENLLRRLDTIRKAESVEHYEAMWCCKDGRKISVAVTTSPLRDFSGKSSELSIFQETYLAESKRKIRCVLRRGWQLLPAWHLI